MISFSVVCFAVFVVIASASIANTQTIESYGKCIMPNDELGNCIHLEQCTYLYNMLLHPQLKKDDKAFLSRCQCGSDNQKVLICCPEGYIGEQQPNVTSNGLLPRPGVCGNTISNRIFGGSITKLSAFPWMALIEYDKGNGTVGHHCGGSLINQRYVLTAAHCIGSIKDTWRPIHVRLGEWDTLSNRDCIVDKSGVKNCADPHIDVPIEKTIIHPEYVSASKNKLNDIALLRLTRSVLYTNFIHPICLPIKDSLKRISFNGRAMDIAGWGYTEKGIKSRYKLKAEVSGIRLSSCQRLYGRKGIQLENSQICAGGEPGVDSCKGDSGGGLIALDASNRSEVYYYIAGIVSFGPTLCGSTGWPGVYTKVSSHTDWILQNIEP